MLNQSVYCAVCICGRRFESELREFVCPGCYRLIVLEWGREAQVLVENSDSTDTTAPEIAA